MVMIKENDIPKTLKDILTEIAEKEHLKDYTFQVEGLESDGGNYLGDLFLIDVIEKNNNQDEGKVLHLFAKVSNIPENSNNPIPLDIVYKRESFMYETIRKIFKDLEEKHNIPEEERFHFAKYYGSKTDEHPEVIVLENLKKLGYTMYDRQKSMDWEYARRAVAQLARYHALSFAFQCEQPDKFDTLVRPIKSFQNESKEEDFLAELTRSMSESMLQSLDERNRAAASKFLEENDRKFWDKHYAAGAGPCVLVHGDFKISNIMVKYEEGKLTSLLPLDFQTIFCGSPLYDLVFLIYTSTDAKFRAHYFDRCVDLYYETLAKSLAMLGQDVKRIYPREQLMEDLKEKMVLALMIAIYMLPAVLVEPDEALKLVDYLDAIAKNNKHVYNDLCRERVNDIVTDLIDRGVLKE